MKDAESGDDCRINLIIQQLEQYDIKVAALQETKWMGSSIYHVGNSIVVAAGQPVPGPGEPLKSGHIVLSGTAVGA